MPVGGPPDDGAAGLGGGGGLPWDLLIGLAVATGGGAGVWWILMSRRRRETSSDLSPSAEPRRWSPATASPETMRPAQRRLASWELASALDDEPIGTVEIGADDSALTPSHQPANDRPDTHDADMHSWGDDVDRRQIRRRTRLSEEDGLR